MSIREVTDAIEEFAAQKLILEDCSARATVFAVAKRFPEATGLSISFALCCVASIIETNRSNVSEAPKRLPENVYRALAVLSADLFELSIQGKSEATGGDLLRHWFLAGHDFFGPVA